MVQTGLSREMTTSMERIHVQEVYDQIAPHFADLKQKAWPKVKQFLKGLEPGSLVADVGCGSGRYLRVNSSVYKIGSDICQPLVQHANQQGHEVITADNLHLPYRDNVFDAVISIGVIHHFSSDAHRIQALKELSRVLSPGGKLMVYVWAFEQKHRRFESQDVLIPWHKPCNPSLRLYRGSCSDIDHSSNSSVSDDDTSSLNSFVFVQDTPPDEVNGFSQRVQSFEDVGQSAEDVFEPEDAEQRSSQNGSFDRPCTLVQECRRLEACLKELSEKQLSTSDVPQANGKKFEFPAPEFPFRKKSGTGVGPCETRRVVPPSEYSKKGSGCQSVPSILPCKSSLLLSKSKLSLSLGPPENFSHQENCDLQKGNSAAIKPGIFQKLKMSLQNLVSSQDSKSSPCLETAEHTKSVPPYMCFEDQSDMFAVREFPMSSLPCSEVSDPMKSQLPMTNGVNSGMTRTMSDVSYLVPKKTDYIKLRSTSVKSLPLELASPDVQQNILPRRRRVQSIGNSHQEQSLNSETKSPLDRNESRKHIVNGFKNDRSRSQGDLQIKGCRKVIKKQEDNLQDFGKVFCPSEDNDGELITQSGQNKKLVRRAVLDSASSDSFLSSGGGVSVGGTPTNADLCRYYHVFKEGELGEMVQRNIEDLHIIDTYFDHANWCLVAEKVRVWKV